MKDDGTHLQIFSPLKAHKTATRISFYILFVEDYCRRTNRNNTILNSNDVKTVEMVVVVVVIYGSKHIRQKENILKGCTYRIYSVF